MYLLKFGFMSFVFVHLVTRLALGADNGTFSVASSDLSAAVQSTQDITTQLKQRAIENWIRIEFNPQSGAVISKLTNELIDSFILTFQSKKDPTSGITRLSGLLATAELKKWIGSQTRAGTEKNENSIAVQFVFPAAWNCQWDKAAEEKITAHWVQSIKSAAQTSGLNFDNSNAISYLDHEPTTQESEQILSRNLAGKSGAVLVAVTAATAGSKNSTLQLIGYSGGLKNKVVVAEQWELALPSPFCSPQESLKKTLSNLSTDFKKFFENLLANSASGVFSMHLKIKNLSVFQDLSGYRATFQLEKELLKIGSIQDLKFKALESDAVTFQIETRSSPEQLAAILSSSSFPGFTLALLQSSNSELVMNYNR